MFNKLDETKVFRDVIHNYIHVDYEIIWDLIGCKEFQRLRRIHQLGGVYQVYHNAEHSRFSHSLGVYEIVRRMCNEIESINYALSEYDKVCVMIAGLLHDIGHMPLSHCFESISPISHEAFTIKIILDEGSEINSILKKANKRLPKDVANIIDHKHPNKLLNQIISAQLDADRMDYLLRDAYFSGTSYGNFDLERVLRTIRVQDNQLVIKESGVHSIENYILARYHMYWQVYYHPVGNAYENILKSLFNRMIDLYDAGDEFILSLKYIKPFLEKNPTIEDHYNLDENTLMYYVSELSKCNDEICSDLAKRLLNRKLFESETVRTKAELEKIKNKVKKEGYDTRYYFIEEKNTQSMYHPYQNDIVSNINVLKKNGEIVELSKASNIVKSLVKGKDKEEIRVYYPKR